jgi:hypothetical protein
MQYALLVYSPAEDTAEDTADDTTADPAQDTAADPGRSARPMPGDVAAELARPDVAGWIRLYAEESATTLRGDSGDSGDSGGNGRMLVTDGPFIDSKEYLAGLILIEAANLDGALATAGDMLQVTRPGTAIEVRPVLGVQFHGA